MDKWHVIVEHHDGQIFEFDTQSIQEIGIELDEQASPFIIKLITITYQPTIN